MESSSKLTGALATDYGSTAKVFEQRRDHQQRTEHAGGRRSRFRLLLYLMIFFASSISYALRVSLSQALVAMVNQTSHHVARNVSDGQCPRDPDVNTTSDDVTRGGEFNWNRYEQGLILAAFYYGYALIQV